MTSETEQAVIIMQNALRNNNHSVQLPKHTHSAIRHCLLLRWAEKCIKSIPVLAPIALEHSFNSTSTTQPRKISTRMPPFWIYWSKDYRGWWWQLEIYDAQSSSQIVAANIPTSNFLQAGCPSCHQTNSVIALKGEHL